MIIKEGQIIYGKENNNCDFNSFGNFNRNYIRNSSNENKEVTINDEIIDEVGTIEPRTQIDKIANGLSTVRYDKDYGFEKFLELSCNIKSRRFLFININSKYKFYISTLNIKNRTFV